MRKIILLAALAGAMTLPGFAAEKNISRVSPQAKILLHELQSTEKSSKILGTGGKIKAMMKFDPEFDFDAAKKLGATFPTKAGNIATANIPLTEFAKFAELPGIIYLETGNPVAAKLDSARVLTHAANVNAGDGTQALNGSGVVVGIIDSGFDYTHPAFRNADGTLRVKRVWEQFREGNPPEGYELGNELDTPEEILANSHDLEDMSHGAHVAGIVAGSEVAGAEQYRGLAPEADMVIVALRPPPHEQWTSGSCADIVDAVNYIYNYAESVGKPAVVNLSWGCSTGSKDGTSLFSQAIDNLTGKGKIFVASAGNEGSDQIHLGKTFSDTDTLLCSYYRMPFDATVLLNGTWLDAWGEAGKDFELQFQIYDALTKMPAYTTEFVSASSGSDFFDTYISGKDTFNIALTSEISPNNGKPHVTVLMDATASARVRLYVKAKDGTVNLWNEYIADYHGSNGPFVTLGDPQATAGDYYNTLSDLSTGTNTICVAAYTSKTRFTAVTGKTTDYGRTAGEIAAFSSRGTGFNPRAYKPDIAAPGMTLISSVNSYDVNYDASGSNYYSVVAEPEYEGKTYRYAAMSGTSMSSPFVSGSIAMLLGAFPEMTPQEVLNAIKYNAADEYTGEVPNDRFGYGKIDLLKAITAITAGLRAEDAPSTAALYPNPFAETATLDLSGIAGATLVVTDQAGRAVYAEKLRSDCSEIALPAGLSAGAYNFLILRGKQIVASARGVKNE